MATLKIFFGKTTASGAVSIHGVGDDSQEEQTDAGIGSVASGAAAPTISAGGRRGRIRYRPAPVYVTPRLSGRGESGQSLQFSEGVGHRRVVRRGRGDSDQRRQGSQGSARLDFEALNEQELLELIILDAA